MNRLQLDEVINLGGHRRSVNDLYFLQKSVDDAILANQYLYGLGKNPLILSELDITQSGSTFSLNKDAIIFFQGELYVVPAVSNQPINSGGSYKFRRSTIVGPDNPIQYQSGNTLNVHINNIAELVNTTVTGPDYIELDEFQSANTDWRSIEINAPNITFDEPSQNQDIVYFIHGRILHINIYINGTKSGGVLGFGNILLPSIYIAAKTTYSHLVGTATSYTGNSIFPMVINNNQNQIQIGGFNSNETDGPFEIYGQITIPIKYKFSV